MGETGHRTELLEAVTRYVGVQGGESPFETPIGGVMILRDEQVRAPSHRLFRPALCLVVQGAKWTMFGERRYEYRAGQALVVSVELPARSQVMKASPETPYLAVVIEFDLNVMREVLETLQTPPAAESGQSVFVMDVQAQLSDCVLRMIRLLDTPKAIPALYPLAMRELCYWLLTGAHGGEVSRLALASSHAGRVVSAIHALRERFAEQVRIEELAAIASLSISAFHRQFRALTSMTPLQYQKQLRLLEARRLMVSGDLNAETASYTVGYESPSQFSREYARMFGQSPRRDVAALRLRAA